MNKFACEPTKEQKDFIFKTYPSLIDRNAYNQSDDNYQSKPNLYICRFSHSIRQTSRTKHDDDSCSKNIIGYNKYFDWISFEEFVLILNKELMRRAKIKF